MGIQERKEREKERRKQQILVAAKRVFSNKGFNKAYDGRYRPRSGIEPRHALFVFQEQGRLINLLRKGRISGIKICPSCSKDADRDIGMEIDYSYRENYS